MKPWALLDNITMFKGSSTGTSRLALRSCSSSGCPLPLHPDGPSVPKKRVGLFQDKVYSGNPHPFKAIPGPKPSLPFIGTGWQYFPGGRYNLSDLHAANIDKFRRYGPVVKEEFQWRRPMVHLYDPVDIETMFRSQGMKPVRPISEFVKHYRERKPHKYDSAGLANSVGDEWLRLRNILSPVLMRLNCLEGLLPHINDICDDFVRLLRYKRDPRSQQIENLQELLYRLSIEVIYMLSLENRLGCLQRELQPNTLAFRMIASVKLLFESFHELYFGLPLWKFYPTKSYRKLDIAESSMYEATRNRIQEAMEKVRGKEEKPRVECQMPGLMHKLLNTKGLSDNEIRATVIDFMSGGVFTVTNAFSFLLYNLSRNPDAQEKVYAEVKAAAPDGIVTNERLMRLRYLKACVKESFRLTPTIPGVARILPEDMVASGYHIPAGTPVFSNFMVACQHPEIFPEPEKYRPERWLNDSINPFALVPFGFGYRMCVGRRFAEMEMHTALAKIIYNFRLEKTGQEVKCKQAFIVLPSHPVSVTFKDR